MAQEEEPPEEQSHPKTLIIGNYCHDIIFRDNIIITETLGGAASFLSNILDPLSPTPSLYISKVGPDFSHSLSHPPILSPSPTTLFHAFFPSSSHRSYHGDRILRRVHACDPILPSDLPCGRFEFGVAAGVAGEIGRETLEHMIGLCGVMFVDVQGLIRVFGSEDGGVGLVPLRRSGFWELVCGIGFLKCSEDEAEFVDVEEVRKVCCVVVTEGREGCRVYWKEGEVKVGAFEAVEVDPTGAGDSFLGGFVVGLSWGLSMPDAALLGNFFGALTVGQIGVPKFELRLMKVM